MKLDLFFIAWEHDDGSGETEVEKAPRDVTEGGR